MKQAILIAGPNGAGKTTFVLEYLPREGRVSRERIPEWQSQGYTVTLHYLKLSCVELAIARVQSRVQHGGHDIPEPVIRRRFDRGLANLPRYLSVVDHWKTWNASPLRPELLDED